MLVKIAGCGVCHTDLSYFYDGVPMVGKPPLTLGHEISGTVVQAGPGADSWIGKDVLVPTIMPCYDCDICAQGRHNRCLAAKVPGNMMGVYGGFADYIPVPARDLCMISDLGGRPLEHYAVVADAVTTTYQANRRADIKEGDPDLISGIGGGLGSYAGQIAKALGAKPVVGTEIDEEKLKRALSLGADYVIDARGKDSKQCGKSSEP